MLLIAALFTALSVGSLIMFKKVTQHKDGILTVTKDIISKSFYCDNIGERTQRHCKSEMGHCEKSVGEFWNAKDGKSAEQVDS